MAKQLVEDITKAQFLIQKLTSSKEEMNESLPIGTVRLPKVEILQCSGIAFLFAQKAGLGLTFQHGHGFLVRKVKEEANSAGIGLTVGYSEIETVIVLDNEKVIQNFSHGQFTLDATVSAAAGRHHGVQLEATAANFSHIKESYDMFEYSTAKGAIVDVSWMGAVLTVDKSTNAALYGADVSPERILSGEVSPPEGCASLTEVLNHIMASAYEESGAPADAAQQGAMPSGAHAGLAGASAPAPAAPAMQPDVHPASM